MSGNQFDWLVPLWRGGAPLGAALWPLIDRRSQMTSRLITAASYDGQTQRPDRAVFTALDALITDCRPGQSILFVDDVFDTGKTWQALRDIWAQSGPPATLFIACGWYKPANNKTTNPPDFYAFESDHWLVFPHCPDGEDEAKVRARIFT